MSYLALDNNVSMDPNSGLEKRPQNGLLKRREKKTNYEISFFEELDVLFGWLEACHGTFMRPMRRFKALFQLLSTFFKFTVRKNLCWNFRTIYGG